MELAIVYCGAIYKKKISIYRPVSLTSIPCSKVLDRLFVRRLCVYLEEISLLDPDLYGFRTGHSTVDKMLST